MRLFTLLYSDEQSANDIHTMPHNSHTSAVNQIHRVLEAHILLLDQVHNTLVIFPADVFIIKSKFDLCNLFVLQCKLISCQFKLKLFCG